MLVKRHARFVEAPAESVVSAEVSGPGVGSGVAKRGAFVELRTDVREPHALPAQPLISRPVANPAATSSSLPRNYRRQIRMHRRRGRRLPPHSVRWFAT
ncbi:hypothetical protein Adu01nite_91570 [Paractinoplanes durhamensis]|uniref:Uncharacterized protein n=1 Tax=Paractinoplanes durhamensis TaxID=113563 RepID=A0ABQ3ZDC9_9ACTN|nr:hypothetical protein Adu01nite_91570 [Actinoplanes durhamensis]